MEALASTLIFFSLIAVALIGFVSGALRTDFGEAVSCSWHSCKRCAYKHPADFTQHNDH
jgi:hypothetical protein